MCSPDYLAVLKSTEESRVYKLRLTDCEDMAVLCLKLLIRSARYAGLVAAVLTTTLVLTFIQLKGNTTRMDDTFRISQPMYDAIVPLNTTELDRKAAIFLSKYDNECQESVSGLTHTKTKPLCPCVPGGLVGSFTPNTTVLPWSTLAVNHPELSAGGRWKPDGCVARQRVAVVIPFRDRDEHLRILLQNLHPVLQRQQLEYQIFVVEQAFPHIFNKASLMNVGFLAAQKLIDFDCIVFHDVDMLPADDRQPYTCFHSPAHMGAFVDKYEYGGSYVPMFGGVTVFTKGDYTRVNGFSNLFYGWGGEDDDMRQRIAAARLTIYRYPLEVSRYRMLHHDRDHRNPTNPFRTVAYRYRPSEYVRDGVNSIKYKIHSSEQKPLFTWLLVEPVSSVSNYNLRQGTCKHSTITTLRIPIHKCAEKCDANTQCSAFVYDSRVWCFLKRRPCRDILPSESQRLYVKKTLEDQQNDTLSGYRSRPGDCKGGDIGGVDGVTTAEACALKCDDVVECVGFVFVTSPKPGCFLKLVSCVETSPHDGATMYDSVGEYDAMPPGQALDTVVDGLSHYRSRPGDCFGNDIKGVDVTAVKACADMCDRTPKCIAFSYVTIRSDYCWLKTASCNVTVPISGVTIYDLMVKGGQEQKQNS
ncbi:Beta-1,4-N-acetylgalactosaminyltransferase bre-4 [Lamellibrachia satsuma]|nr:Beta-1,4-N-acetylgalactosaminyltransferase bre-4 [Lamellibrachia satsuma]